MIKDNVVEFKPLNDKLKIDYIVDPETNEVVGVTHPDWNFLISRTDDGKRAAFVMKEGDESFGELDSDAFNMVLMCWLLIDDPSLIDEAAK